MNRPDFSYFLAHFTKDKKNEDGSIAESALIRLQNILNEKKIKASSMPWTNANAVCFTECPWSSLLAHTEHYSPYGLGFSKKTVYAKHGGPVYYVRPDHFKRQLNSGKFDKQMWPFVTPFSPDYRPKHMKGSYFQTVDYSHEREWRVPHDFPFEHNDVQFVILPNYEAMAQFDRGLKDSIGRDKFILLDNYKHIESLWPVPIQ